MTRQQNNLAFKHNVMCSNVKGRILTLHWQPNYVHGKESFLVFLMGWYHFGNPTLDINIIYITVGRVVCNECDCQKMGSTECGVQVAHNKKKFLKKHKIRDSHFWTFFVIYSRIIHCGLSVCEDFTSTLHNVLQPLNLSQVLQIKLLHCQVLLHKDTMSLLNRIIVVNYNYLMAI